MSRRTPHRDLLAEGALSHARPTCCTPVQLLPRTDGTPREHLLALRRSLGVRTDHASSHCGRPEPSRALGARQRRLAARRRRGPHGPRPGDDGMATLTTAAARAEAE